MKKILLAITACLSLYTLHSQTVFADYKDGKIYVRFQPGMLKPLSRDNPNDLPLSKFTWLNKVLTKYTVTKASKPFYQASDDAALPNIVAFEFTQKNKVSDIIHEISLTEGVVYAEKVPIMKTSAVPNDPSYPSMPHLPQVNAPAAWNIFNGNSNIRVAVVDNAVRHNHVDLQANTYINAAEANGTPGVDDDNNGYIDDVNGYDVADDDNNTIPTNNAQDHGTHCAGIAGAVTNNNIGVASLGWNLRIIPVKCSSDGSPTTSIDNGYGGIVFAAKAGAHVISCSWGGGGGGQAGQDVINYAWNKGAIIVAAAGNSNSNALSYPGAYNKVYCVASCGTSNIKSGFSNYGQVGNAWVDIIAPGESILSTVPNGGYTQYSGTSMATPLVASLAGMILSVAPLMTQTAVLNCISSSAVNIYTIGANATYSNNSQLGAGRIDALAAMNCASGYLLAPPVANFYSLIKNTCPNTPLTFIDSSLYLYNPATWSWTFQAGTPATSTSSMPIVQWSAPGTYSVAMQVTTPNGNDAMTKVSYITVSNPIALPLNEGFQPNVFLPPNWTPMNIGNDNIYWARTTSCGGFGTSTACARFDNSSVDAAGDRDEMRTPRFDFSNVVNARLRFDVAYKFVNNTYTDTLRVNLSTNCGTGWTNIYTKGGTTLATAPGTQLALFVPLANQWRRDSVDISVLTAGQQNVMMSFVNHGHYGQVIYLDNINLFFPAPTTTFVNLAQACTDNLVTYTNNTTGAASYTWTFQGGAPATSTLTNPSVTYNTPGIYTTTLAAQNGTTISYLTKTISIIALPALNVSFAPSSSVCAGETATLTANGSYTSYTWVTPTVTAGSITVNPQVSTNYTVYAYGNEGCNSSTEALMTIKPLPSGVITSTNASCNLCTDGQAMITLTTGIAPYTYQWLPAGGTQNIATGLAPGCYSVDITADGCASQQTVCVSVDNSIGINEIYNPVHIPQIYPNPAGNYVVIEYTGNGVHFNYKVYNSIGQVVLRKENNLNRTTLDLSKLAKALYVVEIENDKNILRKKLVIE